MPSSAPRDGEFDPGSFRDPASRVLRRGDRVMRVLTDQGMADWKVLRQSRLFEVWTAAGRLIETHEVPGEAMVVEHARVPFWSYPYEWTFHMLRAAALLHLDLLEAALHEGLTLKDATPYNIQFRGVKPVFADIGSFRHYTPGEPWLGYRQFCRQFLYPLMLTAHAGIPFHPLLRGSLEGVTAAQARAVLRGGRALRPGVAADVILQARAERTMAGSSRDVRRELGDAGFSADMIKANLRRLRKVLERTRWDPDGSTWSDYGRCEHVAAQRSVKEAFVRRVASERRRRLVWDLGANDGHYSRLVSGQADTVVAIDGDHLVMDRLYQRLRSDGPGNVLPLVVDLADPSPDLGWRGRERRSLEGRGKPDLVLALAVVHHLVVGSSLPLAEVLDWLRSLDAEVVLEWVPPHDPMAKRLTISKQEGEVHADYTEEALEALIGDRFRLRAESQVEGRRLLLLSPEG